MSRLTDYMCLFGMLVCLLGVGGPIASNTEPVLTKGERKPIEAGYTGATESPVFRIVTTGYSHTCGLTLDGEMFCWGDNSVGELGYDLGESNNFAVPIAMDATFQSADTGGWQNCAVALDQIGYCWGRNLSSEVWEGSFNLTPIPGSIRFRSLDVGGEDICGISIDDVTYCWGMNWFGAAGDGSTERRPTPVLVSGGHTFTSISVGSQHTCGLVDGGAAYCWGNSGSGELGNGTIDSDLIPMEVSGGLVFESVSAGTYHSCGLTVDHIVYCWGRNLQGQLGNQAFGLRSLLPVQVDGDIQFQSISAGHLHTCGLALDGSAYCWGFGTSGQLGDGWNMTSHSPVAVSGGPAFDSISAGGNHTCAIAKSGETYCWGLNAQGQLGDCTWDNRAEPVLLMSECDQPPDADKDGILDHEDICPATVPDSMTLNPNQWGWFGPGLDFTQGKAKKGSGGSGGSYTLADTQGCSCTQIVGVLGLGGGHLKKGCSNSAMADWMAYLAAGKRPAIERPADASLPTEYALSPAYPNPFNPQTTIGFALPEAAHVSLVVYDVMGRRVRVLADGMWPAGMHSTVFDAGLLPSGTYLVRLTTPEGRLTRTIQLVK